MLGPSLRMKKKMRVLHLGYPLPWAADQPTAILVPLVHKVRKKAKIRNRYNHALHLTQDTDGKVTTSQLGITNESQEVSPSPAGDHNAPISRCARKHNKSKNINNINDPQKKHRLGTVSKNILLEGLNWFTALQTHP